jgi:branched-chain amino acid aminotransferase
MLYLADELFFTGTAAEITPIRSVDRIEVGNGRRGPITESLQKAFFGLFSGDTQDRDAWLEGLDSPRVAVAAGSA